MNNLKHIRRFNESLEKDTSSGISEGNVQFLLTLDVNDLDKFNEKVKDVKYRILKSASDAVTLSGCESSVRIERVK